MFIREGTGAGEKRGADEFIARSLGMLAGGLVHWDLGGGGWIGRTCALEADRLSPSWLGECGNASATHPRTSNHAGILKSQRELSRSSRSATPQAARLFRTRGAKNVSGPGGEMIGRAITALAELDGFGVL